MRALSSRYHSNEGQDNAKRQLHPYAAIRLCQANSYRIPVRHSACRETRNEATAERLGPVPRDPNFSRAEPTVESKRGPLSRILKRLNTYTVNSGEYWTAVSGMSSQAFTCCGIRLVPTQPDQVTLVVMSLVRGWDTALKT